MVPAHSAVDQDVLATTVPEPQSAVTMSVLWLSTVVKETRLFFPVVAGSREISPTSLSKGDMLRGETSLPINSKAEPFGIDDEANVGSKASRDTLSVRRLRGQHVTTLQHDVF